MTFQFDTNAQSYESCQRTVRHCRIKLHTNYRDPSRRAVANSYAILIDNIQLL